MPSFKKVRKNSVQINKSCCFIPKMSLDRRTSRGSQGLGAVIISNAIGHFLLRQFANKLGKSERVFVYVLTGVIVRK